MIDQRGPQFVQLVNGIVDSAARPDRESRPGTRGRWPDRRESSAAAAETAVLVRIAKGCRFRAPVAALAGISWTSTASTRACGGGFWRSASTKSSSAAGSPWTSIRTTSASLSTQPVSPRSRAAL